MSRPKGARPGPQRLLDAQSAWPLIAALVMVVALVGWWLWGVLNPDARVRMGDGRNVASYGFDLSACRVPREQLVAAGFAKDGLPAMVEPEVFTRADAEAFEDELRQAHLGKFLVPSDRVIGVVHGGQARAYPLKILNWHEVVNDTLGGVPIVVTYSPLCDAAVVFDRRVGGQARVFGVSGLLCNSNLVMYDRQAEAAQESLWCQLQFGAIAGPAAGESLEILPSVLVPWALWEAAHPETTVLAPDRSRIKVYKRDYGHYFASGKLQFPVSPLPENGWALMTRVLAVRVQGTWRAYDVGRIAGGVTGGGSWFAEQDGEAVRFEVHAEPAAVWPHAGEGVDVVPALWFAWYAQHPDTAGVLP